MFTWMQIMMGSQGLIQKTVPHHWWWIPAGFLQELHTPPPPTTKSRALWFINWPRLSFSLSFLADVENEELRQISWDFNASLLGHALNTHARKDKSVFGLVCATVSPSSVQFQPLWLLALFLATYFSVGWEFAYIWPEWESWKLDFMTSNFCILLSARPQ